MSRSCTECVATMPSYFGNVCLRVLPVIDYVVGRVIEGGEGDLVVRILEKYVGIGGGYGIIWDNMGRNMGKYWNCWYMCGIGDDIVILLMIMYDIVDDNV